MKRIELKNKGPKHTDLAMFWNFYVGRRHDVKVCTVRLKSYLTRV